MAAATTTHAFPLATETSSSFSGADVGPGNPGAGPAEDGTAAGASGSSSNSLVLTRGGLIAIIVVVVIVALVGSPSTPPFPQILFPFSQQKANLGPLREQ